VNQQQKAEESSLEEKKDQVKNKEGLKALGGTISNPEL